MIVLICSLLLSFILGFYLATEVKTKQLRSRSLILSPNLVSRLNNQDRTFSLASLVLFLVFSSQDKSPNSSLDEGSIS